MNPRYNPLHDRTRKFASKFSARFIALVAMLVTLTVVVGAQAFAAPLLTEDFTAAPGTLLTAAGWTALRI